MTLARRPLDAPIYVERAPTSPFPGRISGVTEWTGPVTGARPPAPRPPIAIPHATTHGDFGAGGSSQQGMSEPGPTDPRYLEVFQACLRALGY